MDILGYFALTILIAIGNHSRRVMAAQAIRGVPATRSHSVPN
jgi:hypothetical protein